MEDPIIFPGCEYLVIADKFGNQQVVTRDHALFVAMPKGEYEVIRTFWITPVLEWMIKHTPELLIFNKGKYEGLL